MNLIGINGYIGSGKDTVGNIIQWLICQQNGMLRDSDTFEYCLLAPISNELQSGWKIKKFAAKLKQIASLLTGIPEEKFEDQEFKKTLLGKEWEYEYRLPRESLHQENIYYETRQMIVREFLQRLGTEGVRTGLHTNAWVNALFADYKPNLTPMARIGGNKSNKMFPVEVNLYPKWIITDVRFPNEAQAIKDRRGIVIRIERDECVTGSFSINHLGYKRIGKGHPSEISLDDWKFDYIIENQGTIEELIGKVKEMLIHYEIIQSQGPKEATDTCVGIREEKADDKR